MLLLATPPKIDPELAAAVARYSAAGVAANTTRAYRSAWSAFEGWCRARNLASLPGAPFTVAAYLAARATDLRPSTLSVHLAAIAQAHVAAGVDSPASSFEVAGVLKGVKREHGIEPKKKIAITPGQLRTLVNGLGSGLRELRDRALLLLGFCGGFRRSELVALDAADIIFKEEGILVYLRTSKTDQERRGRTVAIEYGVHPQTCVGAAIEDWLGATGIKMGPLFRAINRHGRVGTRPLNGRAVARVLQGRARAAGMSTENLAGHSLRSGLATAAARARVDERQIAARTGHLNLRVLRGYIQDADPFAAGVTQRLGF